MNENKTSSLKIIYDPKILQSEQNELKIFEKNRHSAPKDEAKSSSRSEEEAKKVSVQRKWKTFLNIFKTKKKSSSVYEV